MAISPLSPVIFVEQGVRHEFIDPGETPVCKGEFSNPAGPSVHGQLFYCKILAEVGLDSDGAAFFKGKPYALHVIPTSERGLIGKIITLGSSPVGGEKKFKTGYVMT